MPLCPPPPPPRTSPAMCHADAAYNGLLFRPVGDFAFAQSLPTRYPRWRTASPCVCVWVRERHLAEWNGYCQPLYVVLASGGLDATEQMCTLTTPFQNAIVVAVSRCATGVQSFHVSIYKREGGCGGHPGGRGQLHRSASALQHSGLSTPGVGSGLAMPFTLGGLSARRPQAHAPTAVKWVGPARTRVPSIRFRTSANRGLARLCGWGRGDCRGRCGEGRTVRGREAATTHVRHTRGESSSVGGGGGGYRGREQER